MIILYLILIQLCSVVADVGIAQTDSYVLVLDHGNLELAVKTYKKIFIMFHQPSCPHCKSIV